ncbi:glutamate receptor ionotropic, kainate glr-3-like [Macrobrachium nipponense]|uniref:glutamate receptor ionotropic, kainate glr-3-like n=1 Tax=Macrobrachium nipponense TaxID=159736 RepID=UPI0030C84DF8
MNFTYSIYEVCDKSYGSIINGTWTGMVGEVLYGRAHIGLGNLGANYARSHAVSFPSISTSHGGAGIIFRRPPEAAKDLLSVFLLPFSLQVWICVLVIMPVCAIALHLTMLPRKRLYNQLKGRAPGMFPKGFDVLDQLTKEPAEFWEKGRIHPIQVKTPDQRPEGRDTVRGAKKEHQVLATETSEETEAIELNRSFAESLWFAATMMMQQGQDSEPRSGPGRMVFGTSWIMSVVLFAAYTSNLVSFFTVTKMTLPFHNLAGLVNTDYKFGTRTGSVYIDNFEVSGNEYEKAYQKLMSFGKDVLMPSYEAALKRTLEGNYAFIGDYVVLDYYQKKDCNLVLLKQQLFETKSSFILPRDSPLLPAVNHFMALMSESGIMEKLRSRWWRAETCDEGLMVTSYESISILEVSSALIIMGSGVVMAAVVCLCEFCRSKCKAKHQLHPKETKNTNTT